MMISPFLFKQKAREALKGIWQTALVVTFFAGIFSTVAQVLQSVTLTDVQQAMSSIVYAFGNLTGEIDAEQARQVLGLYDRLFAAVDSIPLSMWLVMIAANVLSFVLGPALAAGCRRYFIRLDEGEDVGVHSGLLGRMGIWRRTLWLYVIMAVKTFLWSLLFIVPGVIAALRYSMAPYYLADDPSLTAKQAMEKSKATMKHRKFAFFALELSFIGWSLLINVVQGVLGSLLGTVLMLVAAQFMSLALSVYMNASCASFYRAVTQPKYMNELYTGVRRRMEAAGISDQDIDAAGFPNGSEEDELEPPQDNTDGNEDR